MNQEKQDQLIELYLLGDLPPHEREQVEVRYFADPDFLERMDAVEAELIEDYALGVLSAEKTQKIKQHVLNSPYQLEKLKFAETLMASIDEAETNRAVAIKAESVRESWLASLGSFFRRQSWPSFAIPAAAVVLIVGGLTFAIIRMRQQLENLRQEKARLQETIAQQQKSIEQIAGRSKPSNGTQSGVELSPPPPATLATFLLLPVTTRGEQEQPKELIVSKNTKTVQLQLVFEGESRPRFRAVLENADGDEILQKSGLKSTISGSRKKVNFEIPASSLENRTYVVTLKAARASSEEEVSRYTFRLARQ